MTREIQEYIRKDKETIEAPSKQTLYYLNQFKQMDENPGKLKWNWSAALGTCAWMVYRRMYWEAILTFIALILLGEACSYLFQQELPHSIAVVPFGISGNYLYYEHVKRQLKKGRSQSGVDPISATIVICVLSACAALAIYYG